MADSITVTSAAPVSLTVTVSSAASTTITAPASSSLSVTNKGPKGDTGDQGPQGIQGLPGVNGTDGADGADGQGVPTGGVADQIIVKQSATDYDTAWDYIQTITEAVKNVSGGPLDKGTPVHVTGSTGNTLEVIAADAATNYPAHLILNEDLANEAEGRGVALGFINNVDVPDASIYTEGQTVYLGASGGWTTTKPTGTNAIQNLGVIVKVNVPGNKISGVVLGAGRANDVPNLPSGKFFIGSATYTSESAYTLPTSDGTTGQLLQTDGAGAVTFVDFSGSPWTTSGSDIYYTTGNVGVGTTTPSQPLHVDGNAKINGILDLRNSLDTDAGVIQVTDVGAVNVSVGIGNMTSVGTRHIGIGEINNTTRYDYVGIGPRGVGGGNQSVVIGDEVAGNNSGAGIVAIGQNASRFASGSYSVGIGVSALYNTGALGAAYTVAVGNSAGSSQSGTYNSLLGKSAGQSADGSYSLAAGAFSGSNMGENSVALGAYAAQGDATSTFSNTVAVGYQALTALTTGIQNTAIGYQAGDSITTTSYNTLLGYQAGQGVSSPTGLVAIGSTAGKGGASYSTFVGHMAGSATSGGDNTAIGFQALNLTTGGGTGNVAIGRKALGGTGTMSSNVAIGQNAGVGYGNKSNNVLIGHASGSSLTTGSSNVLIGYTAGNTLTTESNKLYIENSNSTTPLIYGEFDNDLVRINGDFEVTGDIDLSGGVTRNILVGGDQYVFQYAPSGAPTNFGLYFNLSNTSYDFNDSSATPMLSVDATNGNTKVAGNLTIGDPASTGYAFPAATGTLGQVLEVDASGDLVFATPSGGGSSSQIISHTGGRLQVTTGTDNAATGISLFGNQGVMHDEIFAGLTVGSNLPASGIGTPGTTTVSNMFNSTVPATFQYAGAAGTARFVLSLKNAFFNVGYNTGTLPTFRFFLLRLDSAGKTAIANGTVPTSYTGELVASATWTPANTSQWWNAGSVVESSNGVSIAEDDLLVACCLCDATVSSTQYLYINSFKIFVD